MNQAENRVDYRLWHVLAGDTIHMPLPNSYACYFPQGHVEHAQTNVNFGNLPRVSCILRRVIDVRLLVDLELEEVYAKITLSPQDPNGISPDQIMEDTRAVPKIQYYEKSLNASDLKNLYVPLDGVEMFPKLDYSDTTPTTSVTVKDIHGEIWVFKYVCYVSKHMLTTGWKEFARAKNLVEGNSVVFTRADNGELFVGLRRGEGRGKARPEDVVEAVSAAVNDQPFEITYYPRASTPEFVVKASRVKDAGNVSWNAGMRVTTALKTEGSSLISTFFGTVYFVGDVDPLCWPNSLWRRLQVNWDEEREQLQNVQRVSPWLVQPVVIFPEIEFNNTHQVQLHLPKLPDGSQPQNENPYDQTLGSSSSSSKDKSIRLFGQQMHPGQHSSGNKGKEIDGMASSCDCEVFLESETVRCGYLDLFVTGSYEEVEKALENLLGDERFGDSTSVTYDDSEVGVVKRMGGTGEELFSEVAEKAKKLTVKVNSL